ncbi:MAG: hypothetical protein GY847_32615 [Proteobacteria bacterium]|nr:hypothetical protein [Pseudomonadota bacterium]
MDNADEKRGSLIGKGDAESQSGSASRIQIAAVLGALVIASAVFFIVPGNDRIPSLPRAVFSSREQDQAMAELSNRVKGFKPTDEEQSLVEQLKTMHRSETMDLKDKARKDEVEREVASFRQAASGFVAQNEKRYLLLGDYLAVDFNKTLDRFLSLARDTPIEVLTAEGGKEINHLKRCGGAFLLRAVKRGAISSHGRLSASRITPQTLFRIRWRHLGKMKLLLGIKPVEQKAYFDFVAAFGNTSSVNRRLSAIKKLKTLDESYNDVVARAIVLHEAGRDREAYKEVLDAIEKGRSNVDIRRLAKAFSP